MLERLILLCGSSFIPEWVIVGVGLVVGVAGLTLATAVKALGLSLGGWKPYRTWMRDGLLLTLASSVGGYVLLIAFLAGLYMTTGLGMEIDGNDSFKLPLLLGIVSIIIDGVVLRRWARKQQTQALSVDAHGQLTVDDLQRANLSPWRTALIANIFGMGLLEAWIVFFG